MIKLPMYCLTFLVALNLQAQGFNVTEYGARNDTAFNSTQGFQKAIDACHRSGGGRVLVPAGRYTIGSIFLKSNVELHLTHGAVVYGSKHLKDYRPIEPGFESLRTNEATIQLIYAEKQQNIAITGTGQIDGRGRGFKKQPGADEGIARPHLLRFIECQKVRVENVSLKNAACWMQHFLACTDVFIRGLHIINHANYNNDGIDIDGCKNVVISDIIVDSDDDAIVLKSTSDRVCENVTITNSVISSHCNALKLGTESNGGFKNIAISNCVVKPSQNDTTNFYGELPGISGIALEMVDGGSLQGVVISNIRIEGTTVPLFIRLGERNRPYKKGQVITNQGDLYDVEISHVTAVSAGNLGCSITGTPTKNVEGIRIRDSRFVFPGGGTKEMADRNLELGKYGKEYPEATMFGHLPAYGLYIRKVNNIVLKNVEVSSLATDSRPAFYLEEVEDATLAGTSFKGFSEMEAGIHLKNSSDILLEGNKVQRGGKVPYFLKAVGMETTNLRFDQNDFTGVTKKPIQIEGVSPAVEEVLESIKLD